MLKLPTRPEDKDKARELFWDEEHWNAVSTDSGVFTSVSTSSSRKRVLVPRWAVGLDQVQVMVKEWEHAQMSARNHLSAIEQRRPNSMVCQWLMNNSDMKGEIKVGFYHNIPWLALAAGDHKLNKLMGPVLSDHFNQMTRESMKDVSKAIKHKHPAGNNGIPLAKKVKREPIVPSSSATVQSSSATIPSLSTAGPLSSITVPSSATIPSSVSTGTVYVFPFL